MNEAFAIKDCTLLAISTGQRAQNLRELRDQLDKAPPGSIYYHFWGNLLRPHFDDPEYPNDFAAWAQFALNDPRLAERLALIAPSDFDSLEDLRLEVIEVVEERLDETEMVPWAKTDKKFEFIHSQIVIFDTRRRAQKPEDLKTLIPQLSSGSVFYHFIDARRRLTDNGDDFSAWLSNQGDQYKPLIEELASIDPYFVSLFDLQRQLIPVFEKHL